MVFQSRSAQETFDFGKKIGEKCRGLEHPVLCLEGDLGTGKTVFAKGLARGLGVAEPVTSPTFTIVKSYVGDRVFHHFDVYRIADPAEMEEIGYEEYFYGDGVVLIEWAGKISELLPPESICITIEKDLKEGFDFRKIQVEGWEDENTGN